MLEEDGVSVSRWFLFYGVALAVCCVLLGLLTAGYAGVGKGIQQWFAHLPVGVKLLGLGIYTSLCCTFLPLPTGWIIAAVATRAAAVGTDAWTTALIVASVGGVGSTIANLNDYHLFTLMLRHRKIGAVRKSVAVRAAMRWFSRAPFFILVVFNVVPIPVDLVRILATTYRYPRLRFTAANFIGRFVRYGVIAYVTYRLALGWMAVIGLLALAVVLGVFRILTGLYSRGAKKAKARES